MKLVKYRSTTDVVRLGLLEDHHVIPLSSSGGQYETLADLLESDDPVSTVGLLADRASLPIPVSQARLLAPIDGQEVWAAGVTYKRSKTARMEESQGAANFYDLVYTADRPELFFKATPHRVAGPGQAIRIRKDSEWSVPEPELALVLNSRLDLVGFTIGNDVTSRDIEGANPLYLPQAKVYDQGCALGPCVTLRHAMSTGKETEIQLLIHRRDRIIFDGKTHLGRLARKFEELIGWLARDNSFPNGAILLTGTGIIPPDELKLQAGDVVEISITGIGTLLNPVVRG
jgi:2-dehydro-3-deoxy-D-arabinonate dehydratase